MSNRTDLDSISDIQRRVKAVFVARSRRTRAGPFTYHPLLAYGCHDRDSGDCSDAKHERES